MEIKATAMSLHRHIWLALAILVLPCNVAIGRAPEETYYSTASEVRISFFATDEHDRALEHLQKEDFAVVDDSWVIRDFRSFTRADETVLDVVVLVDASESVEPRFAAAMREVLRLTSDNRPASVDNLSVLSFSGIHPAVICSGDCRSSSGEARLGGLHPTGATPLFDALAFAGDFITEHRRSGAKPVLILFSDGDDNISRKSAAEGLEAVVASGAAIYSVDLGYGDRVSEGSRRLKAMSEATGGRYFRVEDGVEAVQRAVLDDFHASYVVTYQLPNHQPGFHSLRILPTHNLSLRFYCRNGYYYENSVR